MIWNLIFTRTIPKHHTTPTATPAPMFVFIPFKYSTKQLSQSFMEWRSTQIAKFKWPTWAHLCPVGPRWAPHWPHEPCYQVSETLKVLTARNMFFLEVPLYSLSTHGHVASINWWYNMELQPSHNILSSVGSISLQFILYQIMISQKYVPAYLLLKEYSCICVVHIILYMLGYSQNCCNNLRSFNCLWTKCHFNTRYDNTEMNTVNISAKTLCLKMNVILWKGISSNQFTCQDTIHTFALTLFIYTVQQVKSTIWTKFVNWKFYITLLS